MTARRVRFVGLLPLALALSCGSSGRSPYSLDVGSDDSGSSISLGSGFDGSSPSALDAHIERNHVTVTFVTLSCAGPCADVVAVPTGGNAPYTFKWEDGSTSAMRHVCPASTTSYVVTVTDSGRTSGELPVAPQTMSVPLATNVLQCPDAGVDSGAEACGAGIKPGSYEGTFKQSSGVLRGTQVLKVATTAATASVETITGRVDSVLSNSVTMSSVVWGEGSTYDCPTQHLFLTGPRTDGPIPLPYTYEAKYDPATDQLVGTGPPRRRRLRAYFRRTPWTRAPGTATGRGPDASVSCARQSLGN